MNLTTHTYEQPAKTLNYAVIIREVCTEINTNSIISLSLTHNLILFVVSIFVYILIITIFTIRFERFLSLILNTIINS